MGEHFIFEKPRWLRDLVRFLPLKSQFVLTGNVRDLQIAEAAPGTFAAVPLAHLLHKELKAAEYGATLVYDLVNGFSHVGGTENDVLAARQVIQRLGAAEGSGNAPAGPAALIEALSRLPALEGPPVALIVDFASRLLVRGDAMSDSEHRLFTNALIQSYRALSKPVGAKKIPSFNTVIWIAEREGNLPDWLIIDNPRVRHIPVAKPDNQARSVIAPQLLRNMPEGANLTSDTIRTLVREFVEQTEGLLLLDLTAISQLAKRENICVTKIGNAIRNYKVGVTEDPWLKIPKEKICNGEAFIKASVKGQDHAVVHIMDVIKRAVTGIGGSRRGGRPRGVAFLAGPTGVGKTELAKTVTRLLFNDETSIIRFDMSEFSAEHADQRLIGAPPGYVGYDAGGELTNAIRERPFSVVLFDEVEKAHPRILDKFLQVLDDGVLTSGRGERVYFSEAFILFTSNLGIYKLNEQGDRVLNVNPDDDYSTVERKIRNEIDRHFKQVINRPELLNRIGDNIIVFDFVRDAVAVEIFDAMVANTLKDVASQNIAIDISDAAKADLQKLCLSDLSNGGRGIRNKVEAHLVNPLARALFDKGLSPGSRASIVAVSSKKATELQLRVGA